MHIYALDGYGRVSPRGTLGPVQLTSLPHAAFHIWHLLRSLALTKRKCLHGDQLSKLQGFCYSDKPVHLRRERSIAAEYCASTVIRQLRNTYIMKQTTQYQRLSQLMASHMVWSSSLVSRSPLTYATLSAHIRKRGKAVSGVRRESVR